MQLNTITELLDIPNYKVTHVIHNDGNSLHFIVEQIERLPPVCSGCGRVHAGGIYSVWMNLIEDLPISGKRVSLHVPRWKVRCMEDDTIRVEEIPWIRKRFSLRFAKQVYRLTAITTLKDWIVAAMKSKISAFVELGNKFFRKRHFILNYFICNITTAISEGINNKIKRLSRMAYGFKDVYYFLLKIHQHCGMLNPRFST